MNKLVELNSTIKRRLRDARAGVTAFTWLGTGAAGTLCMAVGNTLFGWSAAAPAVLFAISLVATGTFLVGVAAASKAFHAVRVAAIISIAWIFMAGLAALTAPLLAGLICLAATAALVTIGDSLMAGHTPLGDTATETTATPKPVHLDRQGKLLAPCTIDQLALNAGDSLVERIHISEQVSVLHDLQDIAVGGATERRRVVLFDATSADEPSQFISVDLALVSGEQGIVLQHATVVEPTTTDAEDAVAAHKRILAVASHELRTPLNAIIGFSDVLRTKTFGDFTDQRQEEYVNMIHDAGHDLLGLVNTILDVSKIEAGAYALHAEPFDIVKTIGDTLRFVEADAAKKQLHLTTHCKVDEADYVADRRAVRQILTNLLSNAVKFTPEGGCIGVELSRLGDGGFKLKVTDTGIGLTEAEQAMLFKPFAQVDNAYTRQCEGTGLGLALVKGLVELHGGNLTVDSDTNIGTAITVTFPGELTNLVNMADHQQAQAATDVAFAELFQRKAN